MAWEKTLHQIQPGGARGREVQMHARMFGQPGAHRGVLVRGVVVHDEVEGQFARGLPLDHFEEGQPLGVGVGVAGGGGAVDFAVEVTERGEKRDRAVAGGVVGAGADVAHAQGQAGLGAFERLALALLPAFVRGENGRAISAAKP